MNFDNNFDQQLEEQTETSSAEQASSITELEQCQADVALWKEQTARVFADFENYKKRMERDQASWMQTAQVAVLKDLLAVVDNFDRALVAKNSENEQLFAGIEMIYKSVLAILNKHGVKEFTDYTHFDPEFHEALMDIESPEHTTGQIVQILEKGFMVKDKVLRPAKVVIAK